mgnify:CR=1 FL=1
MLIDLTGRHKCCAHNCSCFEYTTVGFTKGFSLGYTFKASIILHAYELQLIFNTESTGHCTYAVQP